MPNDVNHTEKELFRLIAEGNESAFEQLFHLYVPKIEPLILSLVRSEAGVKDIIQEVFLHLWLGREKLSEIEVPANWIFKIVYNRSYSWIKKKLVRERSLSQMNGGEMEISSRSETEECFAFTETSRWVKQAIQNLPPQSKRIYLMREAGLKNGEIAAELGISPHTVKNSLQRSLQTIRSFLAGKGIGIPILLLIWFF